MEKKRNVFARVFSFYYQGFKNMTWGKSVWLVILIKLFIMFVVLKIFFFPDLLNSNYDNDKDRADHVTEELVR